MIVKILLTLLKYWSLVVISIGLMVGVSFLNGLMWYAITNNMGGWNEIIFLDKIAIGMLCFIPTAFFGMPIGVLLFVLIILPIKEALNK